MKVGDTMEVFRVDNNSAYENAIPSGSFRAGVDYKGFGADILAPGIVSIGSLYHSYNTGTNIVDNATCTKVGRCIITKLK